MAGTPKRAATLPLPPKGWPRWRLLGLLGGAVIFSAGATYGWRVYDHGRQLAGYLPPHPALLSERPVLGAYVEVAEKKARQHWSAAKGLEELGRIYHANGFLAEASRIWEGLRQIEPSNPRWSYLLASILAGYGRLENALPLLKQTVELAPDYVPARVRLAETLLKNGQTNDASQCFSEVLKREPANPYARLGLARIDLAARRWPQAREQLLQITASQPDFTPAWALLVTVYDQTGAAAEAEKARGSSVNSGLRVMPDPWLDELMEDCYDTYRLNVAAATVAVTDSSSAVRLLNRALSVDADNVTSHRLLGAEYKKSGDVTSARRHFERAVQLEPAVDLNWTTLIEFLNSTGDEAAGESALARGLVHCPNSPGLLLERVRRLSGQGRQAETLAILQHLRHLHPDEAEYCVKLALLQFRLGNVAEGMAHMEQALALKSDHPIALLVLARNAIQTGNEADARTFIARMRSLPKISPQDLEVVLADYRSRFNRNP